MDNPSDSTLESLWIDTQDSLTQSLVHDLNNIICSTYNLSEFHLKNTEEGTPIHDAMVTFKSNSSKSNKILKQILHLSQHNKPDVNILDLGIFINEQLEFIKALLPKSCDLMTNLANLELSIEVDPSELQKSILVLMHRIGSSIDQFSTLIITTSENRNTNSAILSISFQSEASNHFSQELQSLSTLFANDKVLLSSKRSDEHTNVILEFSRTSALCLQ